MVNDGQRGKDKTLIKSINIILFPFCLSPLLSYPTNPTLPLQSAFLCPTIGLNSTYPPPPLLRLLIFSSLPRQSSSPNLSLSPSSSTGTTSRRCSLDHRGMAFWEQPSYARCITNEFRYLQQSVGAKSAPSHSLCFQCTINYLPSVPLPILITM